MALKVNRESATKAQIAEIMDNYAEAALFMWKNHVKKEDLKTLADSGNLDAQILLYFGLTGQSIEEYKIEEFEDENTHEMVPMERYAPSSEPFFVGGLNEIKDLQEKIEARIPEQSTTTLYHWRFILDNTPLWNNIQKELAQRDFR